MCRDQVKYNTFQRGLTWLVIETYPMISHLQIDIKEDIIHCCAILPIWKIFEISQLEKKEKQEMVCASEQH